MTEGDRGYWRMEGYRTGKSSPSTSAEDEFMVTTLEEALFRTITALDPTQLYLEDDIELRGQKQSAPSSSTSKIDKQTLEKQVTIKHYLLIDTLFFSLMQLV